ncbi:MAG: hypothetical protein LBU27_01825 [Candidatus Peribacteria bacterium]|jgi:hypothetical protein|nr:hypothetical protein [Candidatus Peribacteria bacterium]
MGQFFFNETSFPDPNNLAILRNLVWGEKGKKPLLGELRAMLRDNEDSQQVDENGNEKPNNYPKLYERFKKYKKQSEDQQRLSEIEGELDNFNATPTTS